MKRTTNILALLIALASAWTVTLHAQTKFKDYANQSALSSNALFIISKDDAGGGTRHVSFGQLTNQIGASLVHPEYARSGNSNLFKLFFWGDSIVAGVDATLNKTPYVVATNMAPYFTLGHGTHTYASIPGLLAGSFPGDGSYQIGNGFRGSTNDFTRTGTHVFWDGRNQSWIEGWPAPINTNIVITNKIGMTAMLGHSNYIHLSILHADTESPSSTQYRNITNLNRVLSELYGERYYDWWPDLGGNATDGIPASNYVSGTHVHLTDLALSKIGTGIVHRLNAILDKSPVSPVALLKALGNVTLTNTVTNIFNTTNSVNITNLYHGNLSWSLPTYLASVVAVNGGNPNYGGSLSGGPGYGLLGMMDGAYAQSGNSAYSQHHIPKGAGWTNLAVSLLLSTDCPTSGAGGFFMVYFDAVMADTNNQTVTYPQISQAFNFNGVKSNNWATLNATLTYTNDTWPRKLTIHFRNQSGGALTNNVYILDGHLRGYQ